MLNENLAGVADLLLVKLIEKRWVNVYVQLPGREPLIDLTINVDANGDLFISHVEIDTGAKIAGDFLTHLQTGYDSYQRNLKFAKGELMS